MVPHVISLLMLATVVMLSKTTCAIITVGGQHQLQSYKSGTCSLTYDIEGRTTTITLKCVRIVPDFGQNIIAENLFLATGCLVTKA